MQCEELKNLMLNRPTGAKLGSAILVTAIVSYLKFRPVALIVSSAYVTWIYRTFYSNYKIHVHEDLIVRCMYVYENAKNLRKHRPHVFCCFVSSILFLIAIAGHVIDGTYILLICLIAGVLITSKYEIKITKENDFPTPSVFTSFNTSFVDFAPKIDSSESKILEHLSTKGEDSSWFQSQEAHDSCHSDNELLPVAGDQAKLSVDNTQTVLTTSAEYKRKHFSNTSSSESESESESITRGLEFKNIPVVATIEPQSSSQHLDDATFHLSTLPSLPINKKSSHISSKALESEEEISDYEFLEKDDLNK